MTTTVDIPALPGALITNSRWAKEARWRSVAMEMARDIFEVPIILANHGIGDVEWEEMARSPGFKQMLQENIALWRSSPNTRERVELKQLAILEMSLEEMNRALHDPNFSHTAKVELFKALNRNVGFGIGKEVNAVGTGERVSITINMGDDKKVEVKEVTPRVIENVEFTVNERAAPASD